MKLACMHLFVWADKSPFLICSSSDLGKMWFYERGIAKQHLLHNSRLVAGRIQPGQRARIELEDGKAVCYAWCTNTNLVGMFFGLYIIYIYIYIYINSYRCFHT